MRCLLLLLSLLIVIVMIVVFLLSLLLLKTKQRFAGLANIVILTCLCATPSEVCGSFCFVAVVLLFVVAVVVAVVGGVGVAVVGNICFVVVVGDFISVLLL